LVGEDRGARAVQDSRAASAEARGAFGLDAHEPDVGIVDEAREEADRVRAAADARDRDLGQSPLGLENLLPGLPADHRLELAHQLGVRMRPDAGAEEVVRRLDVREPVADRLARRLAQRLRPELDGMHLGAEQAHALDVRPLAPHVLGAHVDDALEAETRAARRGGGAVLARSGLGDDPPLAESLGEERLAECVVQLVRAGMHEVLALEIETLAGGEALRERERRRPARVGALEVTERPTEGRVVTRLVPGRRQFIERRDQRLGDVTSAVLAVEADAHERTASTNARMRSWSLMPGES